MTVQTRKVTIKHGKTSRNFVVREVADWQGVAQYLADLLKPGSVVSLSGPLGAGKTTLVQYLAKTLGAPKCALSPTFALMRIYKIEYRMSNIECRRGKNKKNASEKSDIRYSTFDIRRMVHVDAYRIEDERDLVVLDLDEELLEPGTVVLVEWPENIKGWMKGKNTIQVNINY